MHILVQDGHGDGDGDGTTDSAGVARLPVNILSSAMIPDING